MKDFEDRTGKQAYSQVPGNMKFKDYFLQMDEKQKSLWLGKRKYEMWKDGLVDLDKFIPPYPDRAFTVRELKERDKGSFDFAKTSSEEEHKEHRKKQLDRAKQNRVEREAKMIGARLIEGNKESLVCHTVAVLCLHVVADLANTPLKQGHDGKELHDVLLSKRI